MKELDMEMIVILFIMSMIAAIGAVTFIALLANICILEVGLFYVWWIIFGFTGIIFGALVLIRTLDINNK